MKIKLTDDIISRVEDFAITRIKGSENLYRYRGESNRDKMIEDVLIGTLGEWASYLYLQRCGILAPEPDMKIYEKRRKSFTADLQSDQGLFHVKSQGEKSAKRYGLSWLLQKTDKVIKEPSENEFFIFTQVSVPEVEILGIVSAKDLIDNELLDEPKVWKYRHTKRALYWENIDNSDIEKWRFKYEVES